MKCFCAGLLTLGALLMGCGEQHPAETPAARPPGPASSLPAAPVAHRPAPDTADLTRPFGRPPGPADSLIALGARHYRLSVRVETDSTQPIDYAPAELMGPSFAAPSDPAWRAHRIRGYAETYTFTLRDSLGRALLFRRQLHKPDFYAVAPRDEVMVMHLPPPSYLGYSAALDALVFVCYLVVPGTDVGWHATLLLDRQGRVRRLSPSGPAWSGAADCDPRISPSGRAVLTCSEVLRAGRPPLKLDKPHANLQAARFLNDTTLLVVYAFGDLVALPDDDGADLPNDSLLPVAGAAASATISRYDFVSTPAQRRLPTARILSTSGRVLRTFRLTVGGGLWSYLPRTWVKPAATYLFAEAVDKLVVIPKVHPDSLVVLQLKALPRFRSPQRPHEQRYDIRSGFTQLRLYVDTLHPRRIRYQRLADE